MSRNLSWRKARKPRANRWERRAPKREAFVAAYNAEQHRIATKYGLCLGEDVDEEEQGPGREEFDPDDYEREDLP